MSVTNRKTEKEKEKNLNEALSKICRDLGEDEDINIVFLREECNTFITNTPIQLYDPNYLAILVEEPFSIELFNTVRTYFGDYFRFYKKYVKIIPNNDISYLQYPEFIKLYEIDKDICEILENEHNIPDSYLSCTEWEELQNSELWKKVQIQIAREIIAHKFKNEIFEDTIQGIEESI